LPVDPHVSTLITTSATFSSYIGYCWTGGAPRIDAGYWVA
jgi:hypothetical protein